MYVHKSPRSNWQCVLDKPESDSRVVPARLALVSDTGAPKNLRHHHHCQPREHRRNNFKIPSASSAYQD